MGNEGGLRRMMNVCVCVCVCGVSRKKKPLSPSVFRYTVRILTDPPSETFTVKANQMR